MHKKLSELEGDGWKKKKEFSEFRKVFEGIGGGDGGQKYFKKVISVFFERFRFVFEKHMGKKWRDQATLYCSVMVSLHSRLRRGCVTTKIEFSLMCLTVKIMKIPFTLMMKR